MTASQWTKICEGDSVSNISTLLKPTSVIYLLHGLHYLVFQNRLIPGEGEHLDRKALDMSRDCNSSISHNRLKDSQVAVIKVLTAENMVKGLVRKHTFRIQGMLHRQLV